MVSLNSITFITSYINSLRALHNAQPLTYDKNIELIAQNYSTYLNKNNLFQHSNNKQYGENLYSSFSSKPKTEQDILKNAVDSWYNENNIYDYNSNMFQPLAGHFTALVWKNTKSFGLGISTIDNNSVVVLNLFPPGNILCQFKANVEKNINNRK